MRKKGGRSKNINAQRTMIYAEPGISEYGQVTRALGNGRFEVVGTDSSTRVCKVRGSMYKRVWIQINDIVLVSNREEDNKGDIMHKYFLYEIKQLKDSKLIPENFSGDKENAAAIEFAHI
ncbi:translation initiation factor eIF-1A [Vavraia culicis subsp. floridensis]|uniref:Translation initiation factor eIF-1A n=1 Tax=Vavraia culicis (isolate floridensis) TaxID=948595 RepID=L2GXJ6_VAVCU|nr:translation initiation factor eIF-1A [Vavraia culicis subsp. floridensis]ELA47830.1 translation initiation factor eIF-1A [Vavraia culicis subsp. floridensis]